MPKKLTFYYHKDCDACGELKPRFKEVAKLKGWTFRQVNVEKCKTKICDDLDAVPTVYVGRKKLTIEGMEKLLEAD